MYWRVSEVALIVALAAAPVFSQTVWAVHDGLRLEREDLSNPAKNGNTIRDSSWIRIFEVHDEIIELQALFLGRGPCRADWDWLQP